MKIFKRIFYKRLGSSEKYIKTSKCNTWFPRNKTVYIALLNWSQKLSKGWSGEIIVASYVKQEWKTSSMSLQANIAGEVLVIVLFFVFSFLLRFWGKLLLYFHAIIDFLMSCLQLLHHVWEGFIKLG